MTALTIEYARSEFTRMAKQAQTGMVTKTRMADVYENIAVAMIGYCIQQLRQHDVEIEAAEQLLSFTREHTAQELLILELVAGQCVRLMRCVKGWHDFMSHAIEVSKDVDGELGQFMTPPDICEFMNAIAGLYGKLQGVDEQETIALYEPSCGTGTTAMAMLSKKYNEAKLHKTRLFINDLDLRMLKITTAQILLLQVVKGVQVGEVVALHGNALLEKKDCVLRSKRGKMMCEKMLGSWGDALNSPKGVRASSPDSMAP